MATRAAAFLALLLAACTADTSGLPGDDDGDDPPGQTSDKCANAGPRVDGTWELASTFDLPKPTGDKPLAHFASAFDGVYDPFDFLWQGAINAIPSDPEIDPYRALLLAAAPIIVPQLQQQIPDRYAKLVRLGKDTTSFVRRLGLRARLEVGARRDACDYPARLVVHSVAYRAEGKTDPVVITLAELGHADLVVEDLTVTVERTDGTLRISEHTLDLDFSVLAAAVLNKKLLPSIDPAVGATAPLGNYLAAWLPCAGTPTLGSMAADALPVPDDRRAELIQMANDACPEAIQLGADAIGQDLSAASLKLTLRGIAEPEDTNGDGVADAITAGLWDGKAAVDGVDLTFVSEQGFSGRR